MRKRLFVIGIILSYCIAGFSQNIRELIDQSGTIKEYPKSSYLVLFDSIKSDVESTGLTHVNSHKLYKVLTHQGVKDLRCLIFDYDSLSAFIRIDEVLIWKKDGSVISCDLTQVKDFTAPARAIYWGARQQMIELEELTPGDAVEVKMYRKGFTYALLGESDSDERYIPPMRGHFYDIVRFFGPQPIKRMVYQVRVDRDKPLQFRFYNGEVESSMIFEGNKINYTFSKGDMMPIEKESNMLDLDDVAPKLLLSTSPDWESKSRWFYGVNEDFGSFDSTPDLDAKVAEILVDARTESDSISLLTHWVADNIRYSGISMGEGEGFTLHTGDMTFTDRCGVCKDKAGILVAMLRVAGFESYAAMTMAGTRIDRIPADQFNHSVTVVKKRSGEFELLDPTWVPFIRELWSSAEQQQHYLLGLPEGADLMETEISNPQNHYMILDIEGELNGDGDYNGVVRVKAEGQTDASIRRMFLRNLRSDWDRVVKKELSKIHPDIEVMSLDYGAPYEYLSAPIEIIAKIKIPKYAKVLKECMIYQPISGSGVFKSGMSYLNVNTGKEIKKYGFKDRCSRKVTINEVLSHPKGSYITENIENMNVLEDAMLYDLSVKIENNNIKISQQISLPKRVYEAHDWPVFKKIVDSQKTVGSTPVIINF